MSKLRKMILLCSPSTAEEEYTMEEFFHEHKKEPRENKLDKTHIRTWVENMENADGTTGPHWTMEQTTQVMKSRGINVDPEKFWCTMNMVYSDYVGVASKLGVNNVDFYSEMALAFLHDKDAVPDKLAAYYTHVVKR